MKIGKRNDIILIVLLFLAAGILFAVQRSKKDDANLAVVTVAGEAYGSYLLTKEQTVSINDHNRLQIKEGKASITEADCPDRLCVRQGEISHVGESIICLPNQVVVTITGKEGQTIDAVVY